MKQKAKELLKHPLVYGSAVVFFGNLLANFFNFLFNLFMSRNLSISDYGTLASIIPLIGLPLLVANAISPTVIRFAGNYFAKNKLALIRGLYFKTIKFLFSFATIIFIFFLLFLSPISEFFQIENKAVLVITNIMIFIAIIGVVNMSLLQAKLAFAFQVFINLLNSTLKLGIGFIFVFLGYSVTGAVGAMLIAGMVSYLVSFIPLKFIFDKKMSSPAMETKELFSYGVPSAVTFFGLTSLISTDIILVKHFFDPTNAGLYAGLSLIGRVIFYISAPIGSVMFPLIVQKHSRKENFTNTFKFSLFLVCSASIVLTLFYYFFPKFTILFFLKKEEYLALSSLLWLFGIFIALYSLLTILSNFYLSIEKTKIFLPIFFGAILQIVLIYFYHDTFLQIIFISLLITLLLVIGLLLYYPYATKR